MSELRASSGVAEGTIRPARFVAVGTDEGAVIEGTAGAKTVGISFRDTRRSDYVDSTSSPGVHALTGEPVKYYTTASECWLEVVATISAGDLLKSDGTGKGTPVTANNDWVGARALADSLTGQYCRVEVMGFYYGA